MLYRSNVTNPKIGRFAFDGHCYTLDSVTTDIPIGQ